jgi:hypothetical protein
MIAIIMKRTIIQLESKSNFDVACQICTWRNRNPYYYLAIWESKFIFGEMRIHINTWSYMGIQINMLGLNLIKKNNKITSTFFIQYILKHKKQFDLSSILN